jgi:hypothetical protein
MPTDEFAPILRQFYTTQELLELRRANLRHARSFPLGAQRNQHRQIALSLRAQFKNKK